MIYSIKMIQLTLQLNSTTLRTLIVDTMPARQHRQPDNAINIGLEYAAAALHADVCHWQDTVDIQQYKTIGFNIMYPLFILNVVPFLRRHGIEPLRSKRISPRVVVGGPGASNLNNALCEIADETYLGEADGDYVDGNGWHRMAEITTKPLYRNNRAVIEIARGCNHRCKFCEYAHVLGGRYREKSIDLAIEQLNDCIIRKTKRVVLRTSNLSGYSQLERLLEHCTKHGIYQGWADIAILDADRILPWLEQLHITAPKIGIESFDEATRKRIGKHFTNDTLECALDEVMKRCNLLHIYLIYGLPDDNYDEWFRWIEILAHKRSQHSHNIRIDFSLTNFNPCRNTPMENCAWVDFEAKHTFLKRWIKQMKANGFYKQDWDVRYGRDYGRHGRKPLSYEMIMRIRHADADYLTPRLLHVFPRGIGRSTSNKEAVRFLNGLSVHT